MKKFYETWQYDDGCVLVFAGVEGNQEQITQCEIPKDAKFLHRVEAETWEEAQMLHYLKMDWGTYKPIGESEECPNSCGAIFYPEGSGECPNCGKIC